MMGLVGWINQLSIQTNNRQRTPTLVNSDLTTAKSMLLVL